MGKYSGILICSDYDGTLASGGKLLPGNAAAIAEFVAEGGFFTIISGRTQREIERMTAATADQPALAINAPVGALNGTLLYDRRTGAQLYTGVMEPDTPKFVHTLLNRFDYIKTIHFFDDTQSYRFDRAHSDEIPFEAYLASLPANLHKCCIHTGPEHSAELRDLVCREAGERYNISRSWNSSIEMQSSRDSKGMAITRIRELLGSEITTVIGVGDYENDIPMFEAADISYAIGGGSPLAVAAADHVTVPVGENAIAHIIATL